MSSGSRLPLYALAFGALGIAGLVATFERPPIDTVQRGFRGVGMVENYNPRRVAEIAAVNQLPPVIEASPPSGTAAREVYQNVPVLGHVDSDEFIRLMSAITEWVAPEQGCAYCHAEGEDLSSDSLYTKVVARRMLQMTQHINADWQAHVAGTGVTCYTCHRGQPVPALAWATDPGSMRAGGTSASSAGQNHPAPRAGLTSLPLDPLTRYLSEENAIRVVAPTPLPEGHRTSIKQTEGTYALMMHMSESLGVNCTYCHNSRSFTAWDQSTPQRTTAWQGIQMVRDLNRDYLLPLTSQVPVNHRGPTGDVLKISCATCHQGVYKPLFGASMLQDFPDLGTVAPAAHSGPTAQ